MDDRPVLRPAALDDVEPLARIWYDGWREAHLGRVPDELLPHRTPDTFRARVPVNLPITTVATVDSELAGFVVVRHDEVEQMYVDARFRGSGVAAALLAHGESVVAERYDTAWLAVVDGNARARRFYERCGWRDTGAFDEPAWTPDGPPVPVPSRRYEKLLAR